MLISHGRFILVVGGDMSYAAPYRTMALKLNLAFTGDDKIIFKNPGSLALVVFTGGHDVSPSLYGKTKHKTTYNCQQRDEQEEAVFLAAKSNGIPMAGICRGAQFLCVMAGGSLIQDITGHGGASHNIKLKEADGSISLVAVNSSHHQMQNPFSIPNGGFELVGWSETPRSGYYAIDATTTVSAEVAEDSLLLEPDIVFYPNIKALGAQYHPEWLPKDHAGFKAYESLLERYIEPLIQYDKVRAQTA